MSDQRIRMDNARTYESSNRATVGKKGKSACPLRDNQQTLSPQKTAEARPLS